MDLSNWLVSGQIASKTPIKVYRRGTFDICVMGLAGIELTFTAEAHTVLHFVLVARTVLVSHQCFVYLSFADQCWHSKSASKPPQDPVDKGVVTKHHEGR